VLESGTAAGGEALVALEAWRAAQSGKSLDEVVAAAREVISRVRLLAYLDTLYYLWKGGRVPGIAHLATSLLKLKPLFELREGEVRNLARPRTRRHAATRLLKLMKERVEGDEVHVTVIHADAADEAERLRQEVSRAFTCEELFISEFTPVMGTHTGPGALGIAFWSR
jgi:DegV family protein with EDD domain